MTKRTRSAWGRPFVETRRNAFKRPIVEAKPKNAWGRQVAEVAKNPWGRPIVETARNAWGREVEPKPKAPKLVTTTKAPDPAPKPASSTTAAPIRESRAQVMEIRESCRLMAKPIVG